ncbi:triose-phosphate isomerase family protein [Bifidobacterium sp. ESL0790]|uniref:triose-phosphate isomerase family protein n=1 Tax=Bifidobacterium sp. ESL0790 TaxID=2983233 RepID=UPI0023F8546A|nr:triose-phosphate isomerase family protein [Bifidobacterium sp. ESL0790]WEV72020.1 triose-phosphate isomerase [Bifidobacterium sp. ESL0790]
MRKAIVALSLKMYFSRQQTLRYCQDLAELLRSDGLDEAMNRPSELTMAVLPDFLTLPSAADTLRPLDVEVGSQNIATDDHGAFTGEVSGVDIASLGASIAEIGHVERRTIFHEDDVMVARKVQAAWRNGLTPLLCVGEQKRGTPEEAVRLCLRQIESAESGGAPEGQAASQALKTSQGLPLWIAYEPRWAIGASEPAPTSYVKEVCGSLKEELAKRPGDSAVIYGGSAGPGLLTELWPSVDGLFLGRFAHKPEAFMSVVHEAIDLLG